MNNDEIVMYDSDEAAFPVRVEAWESRNGYRYFKEESARYQGCTHRPCGCGRPAEKSYTACQACRDSKYAFRYKSFPQEEWDGESALAIYGDDQFFLDIDDLMDYCEDLEVLPSSLELVICRIGSPRSVSDIADWFCDDLPDEFEDWDQPILDAIETLNKALEEHWPTVWFARDVRPTVESVMGFLSK